VQRGKDAPPAGSEPQVLRVTLEPLDVAEDNVRNEGMGNGDMWTRETGNGDEYMNFGGMHSTFQSEPPQRPPVADNVSMELSNF